MNDFYYLDAETVDVWGIEPRFLRPVLMLSDLDAKAYVQSGSGRYQLFYCKAEPHDLRGTGAGRYINWASRQETGTKKQSAGPTTWEDALSKQGGKYWWWPKAALKPTRIALRKAVDVLYAPFIFEEPTLVDQRLYTVTARAGIDEDLVKAYLCSSLFPLSLEVNADLGLGAGALTLNVRSITGLPAPDLKKASEEDLAEVRRALKAVLAQGTISALSFEKSREIRRLDTALLDVLGISADAQDLGREVSRLANSRKTLASKRKSLQAAAADLDIGSVAESLYERLNSWLSGRQFPEDYQESSTRVPFVFPASALSVQAMSIMGQCDISVSQSEGKRSVLYSESVDASFAEVILRSLQMGRRNFEVANAPDDCMRALDELGRFLDEIEERLSSGMAEMGIGPRWEGEVRRRVLDRAGLHLSELRRPFESRGDWPIPALR
ncbi:hypothetical protein [Streptomyces diastaticus]|uniref:hypothetical protein n=1 Tax=Streptomyces diastaticus TaxID=1956 RepID=UPI00343C72DE